MSAITKNDSFPSAEDIYKGNYIFPDNLPVGLNEYQDMQWSDYHPDEPTRHSPSNCTMDWLYYKGEVVSKTNQYKYCLTDEIVADIKSAAVTMLYYPFVLPKHRGKGSVTLATVKSRVDILAQFFSIVILEAQKDLYTIEKLSDINYSQLKKAIPLYKGRGDALKRALKLISNNVIQSNLINGSLDWQEIDINSKKIRWPESKNNGGYKPFSDEMFLFMSENARKTVVNFKFAMDMELHDKDAGLNTKEHFNQRFRNLNSVIPFYLRELTEDNSRIRTESFIKEYNYKRSDLRIMMRDVFISAMWNIMFFTGMRDSELRGLLSGCMNQEKGYWFLYSRIIKHKGKNRPIDQDAWIAIDIVKDSVEVLEYIAEQTGNKYLFASYEDGNDSLPIKNISLKFRRYMEFIDKEDRFKGESLHPHRFRETLVNQLAKADVGLAYISMQLKHFHSKFKIIPNDVTVGYGNYKKELIKEMTAHKPNVRSEALMDLYGEGKSFAGGAAEKHTTNVESFFTGLGLFGDERVKYIESLARTNYPLIPTSIGGCTRDHREPCSNDTDKPRCYGDYMCDPECSNHLLPESSKAILIQRRDNALDQAKKPEQSHNIEIWNELANQLNTHVIKFDNTRRE